ncbi:MAG: serine hydrolase [Candidatus Paceibacterota bacterium]
MKKKILITLLLLFFLFSFKADASSVLIEEKRFELLKQIEFLQKEVQRLMLLISKYNIEKEISAHSYIVMDISNNSIILGKNTDKLYPIASVTKLMNAVITIENINTTKTITLTEKMLKPLGYSPSLFLGLNIDVKNLLKASLIQSTNDAAEALTYFLEEGKFLELMNKKAEELGMDNTKFYDSHGLNPLNRSTSKDLVKLLLYIHKNHPEILEIGKDDNFWLPDNTGRMLKFKNVNNFYNIPEFIGGKTGYLPEAKQTLASLFDVKEKPIAIVLLYSENRQTDTLKILNWLKK